MQVTTLIIAILGWVTATAALTWNVVSWLLAGARATVEFRVGALVDGNQYLTQPIRPGWQRWLQENMETNGLTGELMLFVNVRNTGRTRLTIHQCGFRASTGEQYSTPGGPDVGEKFPITLEAGDATTLGYNAAGILAGAETSADFYKKGSVDLRARVELGSGKLVNSKEALTVPRRQST